MALQFKVYKNLHKNCYSIQNKYSGLVVEHATTATLLNVSFVVQPAGRQRVLDTNRKNVHAFAVGERLFSNKTGAYDKTFTPIHYDPYEHDYFYTNDGRKVLGCAMLVLNSEGMFGKELKFAT